MIDQGCRADYARNTFNNMEFEIMMSDALAPPEIA